MKLSDVVQHLAYHVPRSTDLLTTNVNVLSMVAAGTEVTVTCDAAHNLVVGAQAFIEGAQTPISVTSFTRAGTVGSITLDSPHDVSTVGAVVSISGAVEPEFNGDFVVSDIPSGSSLTVDMVDAGPTTATGAMLALGVESYLRSYNGLQVVTGVPSTTVFTFDLAEPLASPAYGTIVAKSRPRIGGAADGQALIEHMYKHGMSTQDISMYVILGDVEASRSRDGQTDAVMERGSPGSWHRQNLLVSIQILVAIPSKTDPYGAYGRDIAEDLFPVITGALLGMEFPHELTEDQKPLNFVNHGTAAYGKSIYWHSYIFQGLVDLTSDDGIMGDDVAIRHIQIQDTIIPGTGINIMTADMDL